MIGAVQRWLLSILSAAMVCALADGLMPQGAVRRVGKLVCGLVLMAAVLSPVVQLDLEEGERWLEGYLAGLEPQEQQLERQVSEQLQAVIEERCAAYIVDKAAELGLVCRARVQCREEERGVYLPVRAELYGISTHQGQQAVIELLQTDLGISAQNCIFQEEGVP